MNGARAVSASLLLSLMQGAPPLPSSAGPWALGPSAWGLGPWAWAPGSGLSSHLGKRIRRGCTYKEPFYTFIDNNDILITGSHLIEFNNKFIMTENHPCSIQTTIVDDMVYNIITSDHLIKIGTYTFWDYND